MTRKTLRTLLLSAALLCPAQPGAAQSPPRDEALREYMKGLEELYKEPVTASGVPR